MVALLCLFELPLLAQQIDSLLFVELDNVVISAESIEQKLRKNLTTSVDVANKKFLKQYFTGNLMQTLEYVPGVRSMDVGAGFSKPMVRGMGFNRIVVSEQGIKQEGQQWGSDHGLEIDAFNMSKILVYKGPQALQYGSDAIGGVIEIAPPTPPAKNSLFGEIQLIGKSINQTVGGSIQLGIKKNRWFTQVRYTELQFGDYRVPTDAITYLTQKIPIYNRRVKNTAGYERDGSIYTHYSYQNYEASIAVSNVYQKVGFFPGAHGVPDASRVKDDGKSRNIELPYSSVNHIKATTMQSYRLPWVKLSLNIGYQNNRRKEFSLFHTHYGSQKPPVINPNKELDFNLNTYSTSFQVATTELEKWSLKWGIDGQIQQNNIGGYGFLLPQYNRNIWGTYLLADWNILPNLKMTGGIRYDQGQVDIKGYQDIYLEDYLLQMGYNAEDVAFYQWRSYPVKKSFSDVSTSVGIVWSKGKHTLKGNLGKSFRLPGANELASNGVHHGTFRHELGDPNLNSERGWQLDADYHFEGDRVRFTLAPYISWFSNYIYLKPTGNWSILPHAGQIYQFTGAKVTLMGAELSFDVDILNDLNYSFMGEYIYTQNNNEHTPLSFTPPATMRNIIRYSPKRWSVYAELYSIARQTNIAKNEQQTAGANLLNMGISYSLPIRGNYIELSLSAKNILNKKYFNHLSFYRKVEIPEPGRNIQLSILIPLKINLK